MKKFRIKNWIPKILLIWPLALMAQPIENTNKTVPAAHYKIEYFKTQQGFPVYFVSRQEVPIIDLAVIFTAGSAYDQNNWGIAYFTASMLGEGTKTRTATQIAKEFDSVGAQFSSSADRDKALASLRSLADDKYLQPALTTFLDVLGQPNFATNDFERVRGQILDSIRQGSQTPSYVAANAFFASIYGNQPYGHPTFGTLDTVAAIKNTDAQQFYQKYYNRQNAKIIIVGAVDTAKALKIAEMIAGQLGNGQPAANLPDAVQTNKGKNIFIPMPTTQNTIISGQNSIKFSNPDYFNLMVGNQVLGAAASMTSLLFEKVRNQSGLVYGVYSRFSPLKAGGPFSIILQTRSEKTTEAINMVNALLKDYIQHGPTVAQLQSTKMNLLGDFPIKMSTNSGVLQAVANIAFYQLPLDYLDKYTDNIKNVTPESAKNAFAKVVKFGDLNTIVVGMQTTKP